MKKRILYTILIGLILSIGVSEKAKAQANESKYGTDSVSCVRNTSLYREFVKQKNYGDALSPWRLVYNHCPRSSKNIYIDGVKIYKYLVKKEKDASVKEKYIDTLFIIYKKRVEYFGKEGFVSGRMGVDMLRYRKDSIMLAYKYLQKSVNSEGKKTEDAVSVSFIQTSAFLYKGEKLAKSEMVDNFFLVMKNLKDRLEYLQSKGKAQKYIDRTNSAIKSVENYFMESGAADCEVLVPYFEPKFQESPEDIELLKNITKLLNESDCVESNLFFNASKQLYKLEPSAEAAYNIAKLALKKEDIKESVKYYLEAIEKQTDSLEKASYYYELGVITYSQLGELSKARQYAYNSISLDKKNGKPYILIGNIYAASTKTCGTDNFERAAVYWVAVDKFIKAKRVDPEVTELADKYIDTYKQHFPNKEDAFFHGVSEGDNYTVECWINEKTKARFRK